MQTFGAVPNCRCKRKSSDFKPFCKHRARSCMYCSLYQHSAGYECPDASMAMSEATRLGTRYFAYDHRVLPLGVYKRSSSDRPWMTNYFVEYAQFASLYHDDLFISRNVERGLPGLCF